MMNSKISKLSIVGLKPNEEIINALRELLRDAKTGKIQGFAAAIALTGDDNEKASQTQSISFEGWHDTLHTAIGTLFFRVSLARLESETLIKNPPITDDDE